MTGRLPDRETGRSGFSKPRPSSGCRHALGHVQARGKYANRQTVTDSQGGRQSVRVSTTFLDTTKKKRAREMDREHKGSDGEGGQRGRQAGRRGGRGSIRMLRFPLGVLEDALRHGPVHLIPACLSCTANAVSMGFLLNEHHYHTSFLWLPRQRSCQYILETGKLESACQRKPLSPCLVVWQLVSTDIA